MRKKILIIDDDEDILDIVSLVLEEKGFSIIRSLNTDILETVETIQPDLILLDNSVGTTSGSELCKALKTGKSTKHFKVILCSAVDDLKELSRECLANNYLIKPFNLEQLDTVVAQVI